MALDPLELGTIAAILLVFFLWGPQKIPELARMVAQARKEFDNATKEFQKVSQSIQNGTSPLLAPSTPSPTTQPPASLASPPRPAQPGVRSVPLPQPAAQAPAAKTGDQLLIEAARRLGIPTQGKTREQIQEDLIAMAQRPTEASKSETPPPPGESTG